MYQVETKRTGSLIQSVLFFGHDGEYLYSRHGFEMSRCPKPLSNLDWDFFREGQSSNVFSFLVIPLETIVQVFLKVASGDHGNKKEQEETDSWIRYSISGTI
jgi:hypothetical protein